MCCSSPSPPPPPDYSGIAASSEAAAKLARESAAEDLAFRKQVYQDSLPQQQGLYNLANRVADQQMGIADQNQRMAQEQWNYNLGNFRPLETQTILDSMGSQYLTADEMSQLQNTFAAPQTAPRFQDFMAQRGYTDPSSWMQRRTITNTVNPGQAAPADGPGFESWLAQQYPGYEFRGDSFGYNEQGQGEDGRDQWREVNSRSTLQGLYDSYYPTRAAIPGSTSVTEETSGLSPEQLAALRAEYQQQYGQLNDPAYQAQQAGQRSRLFNDLSRVAADRQAAETQQGFRTAAEQNVGDIESLRGQGAGELGSLRDQLDSQYTGLGTQGTAALDRIGVQGTGQLQGLRSTGTQQLNQLRDEGVGDLNQLRDSQLAYLRGREQQDREGIQAQINSAYGQQARNLTRMGGDPNRIAAMAAQIANSQALARVGGVNQLSRQYGEMNQNTMQQYGGQAAALRQGYGQQRYSQDMGLGQQQYAQDMGLGQQRYSQDMGIGQQQIVNRAQMGQQIAAMNQMYGQQSNAQRAAAREASRATEAGRYGQGIALRSGAANFGRNMPNTAGQAYGLAMQGGNAAVANANTGFMSGLPYAQFQAGGTGSQLAAAGLQQQGALGMGGLMNQQYNSQMNAYNAQNAAQGAGLAGLGSLAGQLGAAAIKNPAIFTLSDRRVKKDIRLIGQRGDGLNLYVFTYKHPYDAVYGTQPQMGVMADEVLEVYPDAVSTDAHGFMQVDYSKLG